MINKNAILKYLIFGAIVALILVWANWGLSTDTIVMYVLLAVLLMVIIDYLIFSNRPGNEGMSSIGYREAVYNNLGYESGERYITPCIKNLPFAQRDRDIYGLGGHITHEAEDKYGAKMDKSSYFLLNNGLNWPGGVPYTEAGDAIENSKLHGLYKQFSQNPPCSTSPFGFGGGKNRNYSMWEGQC